MIHVVRTAWCLVPMLALTSLPVNAEVARRLRMVRESKDLLGSTAQVVAPAFTDADARMVSAHITSAFEEMARIEALLDERLPGSAIFQVNDAAGKAPVVVEPEVFALLQEATRVARITQGAFDPTYAAFEGVWRFSVEDPPPPAIPSSTKPPVATGTDGGAKAIVDVNASGADAPRDAAMESEPKIGIVAAESVPPTVPDEKLRAYFAALVNFRDLSLDPAARTAFLRKAGMKISLRGLSRGYALDRAAAMLEARGVGSFILSVGGDLVTRGDKEGEPWMVGVQDPRAAGHFAALPMGAGAVMTSGDYERSFIVDGTRYHHIIDPRTGRPSSGLRSVTVVAGDGLTADALATAVFVLGPKDGMRLVERLAGTDAVLVTTENRVLISRGLKDRVKWRPPTDAP